MAKTKMTTYFAYGSNLDTRQMRERCPSAKLVSRATLRGWRLAFGGWSSRWGGPVATLVEDPTSSVVGVIYLVSLDDLAMLDFYEGHPRVYERRILLTVDEQKMRVWAFTYVMPVDAEAPPAPKYIDVISRAYSRFGFDQAALASAAGGI